MGLSLVLQQRIRSTMVIIYFLITISQIHKLQQGSSSISLEFIGHIFQLNWLFASLSYYHILKDINSGANSQANYGVTFPLENYKLVEVLLDF